MLKAVHVWLMMFTKDKLTAPKVFTASLVHEMARNMDITVFNVRITSSIHPLTS